jgi:hypothetical protein
VTFPLYDAETRAAMLDQTRAEADSADARMVRVREADVPKIATSMRSCTVMPAPPRDRDPTRPPHCDRDVEGENQMPGDHHAAANSAPQPVRRLIDHDWMNGVAFSQSSPWSVPPTESERR